MYVTLNISSKEVRLLSINKQGIKHWSRKEIPSGWIKDGHISEPKGVGAIIVSLLESAKITKGKFVVCISGLPYTYRMAKFPRIKQSVLKESIRHFMAKEISMPIEQMCLSWAVMDESDDEVKLLILGIDQNLIDAIAATMREAKIKYWILDLKSLALARAASVDDAVLISAESDCYDIVIIDNGSITTMHTVYIEEEHRIDVEHAKQILIETSKAITYDTKKRGYLPQKNVPVLLTGELSYDKDFRELMQTEFGYTVKLLTPPLTLESDFPIHLYSTNIGLALTREVDNFEIVPQKASVYHYVNLDIMAGTHASRPKRISAVSLAFPIVLSLVICFVFPIYGARVERGMESFRLQNELILVNQELQQAMLNEEKAREIEIKTDETYAQVETLRKGYQALFGNQGEFAFNLRKVVNALPPQSYFTNVNCSPQGITVIGHADNAFQALDYTNNLEREELFTDIRIQQIGNASGDNVTDNITNNNAVTFNIIISNIPQ
ncbi:pilus assembly protein PilM [Chloroflexota bacterium]